MNSLDAYVTEENMDFCQLSTEGDKGEKDGVFKSRRKRGGGGE